jgi:hypothetical protein
MAGVSLGVLLLAGWLTNAVTGAERKVILSHKAKDLGKVTLNTSMPMPGMPAMIAGATLSPDKTPGRYLGTISFPDIGARQVTITWNGPAGKGSARFSVPVR